MFNSKNSARIVGRHISHILVRKYFESTKSSPDKKKLVMKIRTFKYVLTVYDTHFANPQYEDNGFL